jgi:hypothetical protein
MSHPKDRRPGKSIKGVSAARSTVSKPTVKISSWTVYGDRTERGRWMAVIIAAGVPILFENLRNQSAVRSFRAGWRGAFFDQTAMQRPMQP